MNNIKFCVIGLVLAGSIAMPIIVRHRAQMRLEARFGDSQQTAEQLAALSAENQRLSDQLAAAKRTPGLTPEQERELLQLRSQIGQLRRAAKATDDLRARNQKLLAAATASSRAAASAPGANAQSTADYWVKDQLAYSGYASPESSLKTAFWAASTGDVRTMLECMTPEARAGMEREWQKDGKSEAEAVAELKAMGASIADPSSAFRLLDEEAKSPDEMVANISFEGEDKARKFVLRRVGSEWKIERVLFPGEQ